MLIRLLADQSLYDLLHERSDALTSACEQTFPKAPSGPKLTCRYSGVSCRRSSKSLSVQRVKHYRSVHLVVPERWMVLATMVALTTVQHFIPHQKACHLHTKPEGGPAHAVRVYNDHRQLTSQYECVQE